MTRFNAVTLRVAALAAVALFMTGELARADPPVGSSKMWPWNVQGYQGYNESRTAPTPPPPAAAAYPAPVKYTITITRVPEEKPEGDPGAAHMMAHLPENARIWFEGTPTTQQGGIRYFVSPPLAPDTRHAYAVRIDWVEDGKWVSQTQRFPVRAGEMQCIDIVPATPKAAREEVRDNLAKLSPEDRKLAEEQQFCAVQSDKRLGSMGVPVKITVKGQPVFLCCDGCIAKAESHPDQTLTKVQELKGKNKPPAKP